MAGKDVLKNRVTAVRDGAHFRVWAPKASSVDVVIGDTAHPLAAEDDGYFSALVPGVAAGTRYRLRLDGDAALVPDPASRYNPDDVHGMEKGFVPWGRRARGERLAHLSAEERVARTELANQQVTLR